MNGEEQIRNIRAKFDEDLANVNDLRELNDLRITYLGKKSDIIEFSKTLGSLDEENRKKMGALLNDTKSYINDKIDTLMKKLEEVLVNAKLENESIDVTLPGTKINVGSAHPLEKLIEEVEELFISMGYDIVEGPEVEKDLYNFELLNLPKGHPARDAQDTFYIEGDEILLRSQTSPVQVRTMLANTDKTPIRILCPGKTYRRDNDDATHSHQFMQIEGLLVDKNVSLSDLKGTFDVLAKKLFGEDCKTRFRPSYYQFTEPSVETDISCFVCHGKGCSLCKNTGWITVAGAGIIHPNVLRNCDYDPKEWTGFAFGFGAERLAMLKYGISDIRAFYTTDLRESETLDRKDAE
jgi:phenylalanyl-tRNA synthetase alpha chain